MPHAGRSVANSGEDPGMDLRTAEQYGKKSGALYVCPSCKGNLEDGVCAGCGFKVDLLDEIPSLFSGSALANRYKEIARFYDSVYESREPVAWEAGRGPEFIAYVASLIRRMNPTRYLDIGCGQGRLLTAVSAPQKFGIDISRKAVESAVALVGVMALCQGIAEELPYPDDFFDVVTGIGVMHHFLDGKTAIREVWRVLREGGCYIVNLFIETPLSERFRIKLSEFVYPRFRPTSLFRWALAKYGRSSDEAAGDRCPPDSIVQPVYNGYTAWSVRRFFRRNGFRVRFVITKRRMPDAPLAGHHRRIYVLEKTRAEAPGATGRWGK